MYRYRIFILIFISLSLVSWIAYQYERGYHVRTIHIGDNEIAYFFDDMDDLGWENVGWSDIPELSSALLRAYNTATNQPSDFVDYANQVATTTGMGYWFEVPANDYLFTNTIPFPDFYDAQNNYLSAKSDGFYSYYHTVFQNKAARKVLSDAISNWIYKKCTQQPIDFKYRVLDELDYLMEELMMFESLTEESFQLDAAEDYFVGFLFRRYATDGVPIQEIHDALFRLNSRIASIPDSSLPEAYYVYQINDDLEYCVTADEGYLKSVKTGNTYNFGLNGPLLVQCLKDHSGTYYSFKTTEDEGGIVWLFDDKGKLIE
jgi:hypothetical protein